MPRNDGNTQHSKSRNHRHMKSAAKGKGHDYYLRFAKRQVSQVKMVSRKRKPRPDKQFQVKGPDGYEPPLQRRNDPDMGAGFLASGW